MFDLKRYLQDRKRLVEAELERFLEVYVPAGRICEAMRHCLMAGGKRVRPILCMAAAESVSGPSDLPDHVPGTAAVLELIHTYSLIHDDLPAMDDDDLRRGKPTCHKAFDEATAILAGDGLLTLAFEILSDPDFGVSQEVFRRMRVIHVMARAAGVRGMVEGQMRDILSEKLPSAMEELERMHALKTGALLEASVVTGAICAGASEDDTEKLRSYARKIGLAFQVADDILNVEGDPALMGKAAGTDQERNKCTYPAIMGLSESKRFAERLVEQALHAIDKFDNRAEPLRAIARYIIERNQ